MDETLSPIAAGMEERYREKDHLTLYKDEAVFVDERTVEVAGERTSGEKVVVHGADRAADFTAMPHAIFTEPQMAGVGATEAELRDEGREYVVGRQDLPGTPMGRAKKLDHGFVKVLAAPDGEILGCHILGYEASVLLHEVVVAMRAGSGQVSDITDTIHAHPTLNKAVEYAFDDVTLASTDGP
jgi:pyruvate/2-oxoglutarate dehydrogenase complex dihydrolipoamide dehydrogenase (E3) component